jgi:hypothetical protein
MMIPSSFSYVYKKVLPASVLEVDTRVTAGNLAICESPKCVIGSPIQYFEESMEVHLVIPSATGVIQEKRKN